PVAGNPYSITATGAVDSDYTISYSPGTLTIDKASSGTATDIQNSSNVSVSSVALNTVVHDTATLSSPAGSATMGGTVQYYFASGNITDASLLTTTIGSSVIVAAGVVGNSIDTSGLAAGDYTFKAVYAGDGNFNGSVSSLEHLHVNKADTFIVTHVKTSSGTDITGGSTSAGTATHDTGVVGTASDGTGHVGDFPITGTVTYKLYDSNDSLVSSQTVNVTSVTGDAMVPDEPNPHTLDPGTYHYLASFTGND